ncbi:chromate efflux transporter [Sphingobium phenoxybenzoativorans]|uniref:chromate efflux transporter n=1 Tax=Sphingobium phenoxybenzoativorans TaxID=1592790 RepID=UPI000871D306|nr:chromate efflux transporter [Sphingobium phenoxybenzoativorans]
MALPSFREMIGTFGRIGLISFGGPAGQIALMHEEIVEKRKWVDEEQYLRALNLCHLLPGPEAQQLATWIGWRLHGLRGGLVAGLLFVMPGALVILGLSILYAYAANFGWFAALFLGIKAAVLAIVAQALIRIGKRALNSRFKVALAVASFIALFFLNLPFPLVVLGSGALGMAAAAYRPQWLRLKPPIESPAPAPRGALVRRSLYTILGWLLVWAAPMLLILAALGPGHVLWTIGAFFSQLAVVTFGGAYAVLAYMAQEAVQSHHWLTAGEMADGLGMAETTPGPLIMVTQFVGFLAAFRAPAPFSPLTAGIIGAVLTTWVTFAPCFLWIFALAPWMERLEHARKLQGGLAALTAAVVGVIANLTVWFALHVLFGLVRESAWGPLRLYSPDWSTLDWRAALLGVGAAILLFRFRIGIMPLLCIAALAGLALSAV